MRVVALVLALGLCGCTRQERRARVAESTPTDAAAEPEPRRELAALREIWHVTADGGHPLRVADAGAEIVLVDRPTEVGDELRVLDAATGRELSRSLGWRGGFDGRP